MIEVISTSSNAIGNEPFSAEETLYVSATLGSSFRSFADEVFGATVRFDECPSGEWACKIEVETVMTSVATEASAASKSIAFARAAEGLDRRIFSALYGSLRRAA